jgi:hypothetical protein
MGAREWYTYYEQEKKREEKATRTNAPRSWPGVERLKLP